MKMPLEIFTDHISKLGEGPLYHEGRFYWVDLLSGKIHMKSSEGTRVLYDNIENVATSIVPGHDGEFYVTLEDGFYKLAEDGSVTPVGHFSMRDKQLRFNDGKCDANGNYWAGTMDRMEETPKGALFVLTAENSVIQLLSGVKVSNGLCWSADQETFYYIDSTKKKIRAFDLNPETFELSNRRSVFQVEQTNVYPDGMCIDLDGNIWLALWNGFAVVCIDPISGEVINTIDVPCAKVTSCCFGGEAYDELYITTSSKGMSEKDWAKYPDSGKVFRTKPGVIGLPADRYGKNGGHTKF
jgi:sugar lactone lactonase YvrE